VLGDKRFLRTIRLRNLLSFGPSTEELELRSLNVLIGPNGSGKSNLIEAIGLLQAGPGDLMKPIREGGGISEWMWKGSEKGLVAAPFAEIEVTTHNPRGSMALRHRLTITGVGQRAQLSDEAIENAQPHGDEENAYFYYRYQHGRPVLNVKGRSAGDILAGKRELRHEDLAPDQSVLSQRKDPDQYPEVTHLGNEYAKIKLFREWNLGRNTQPRKPQPTDLPPDFLQEDAANLVLVLHNLINRGLRSTLVEKLKTVDESITDLTTSLELATTQLFLHHAGLRYPVPATRLSDGTVRYLCLLAVLCHPSPPPLVCIEEPELGLHPDMLPGIADLLIEASHRMQLIVTTHSDVLVDALTSVPEAVVVCEKRNGSTRMRRLKSEDLTVWLKEDYGVGQLWRKGELGGNRW
jgi:predicted ATPase